MELTAKRTLATTKMQVTDYSGKIAEVGILVPNCGDDTCLRGDRMEESRNCIRDDD